MPGTPYQALAHCFRMESELPGVSAYVDRVLGRFRISEASADRWSALTNRAPVAYEIFETTEVDPARFRLHADGVWLLGSGALHHVVDHLFWHVNSEAFARTEDLVLIHAGVVIDHAGRAVVLPARSGAGKTTLVAGLVIDGYGYFSDEAAAIDPTTGAIHAFPKALTVKQGNPILALAPHGGAADTMAGEQWHADPDELRPGAAVPGPRELGTIVFPEYAPGSPSLVTALTRAEGCGGLLRNVTNPGQHGAGALAPLAALASRAPAWRLRYPDLETAVRLVRQVLEGT
jgi:hypothetical protein